MQRVCRVPNPAALTIDQDCKYKHIMHARPLDCDLMTLSLSLALVLLFLQPQ